MCGRWKHGCKCYWDEETGILHINKEENTMSRRRLLTQQQVQFGNEGQAVAGRYLRVEEVPYQQGSKTLNKYVFDHGMGEMVVMGSSKIDEAMLLAEIGDVVELTYIGTQRTSNGFDVKLFEIAVLEEEDGTDESEGPASAGPKSEPGRKGKAASSD